MTLSGRIATFTDRIGKSQKHQYGLLAAITLLGALLRFYKLGEWSFWNDELSTVRHVQAHYSSLEAIVQNIPPFSNWVPLSLILTGGAMGVLDASEWSARLVPAIIGVISIPLFFILVKRTFDTYVGLISALLLAVSPWHLHWSQNARSYTSLALLYALALFAFFFGIERDRIGYLLLFMALLYLAVSERMVGLLIISVVFLYLLLLKMLPIERPPGFRKRNLILLSSPLFLMAIYQIYTSVTDRQSLILEVVSEVKSTFIGSSIENPFAQASFIAFSIGIPLIALSFFSGLHLIQQKNRAGLLLTVGAVIPFAIVVAVTPLMFTEERYAFVTLPCWLILGAVGVKEFFAGSRNHGSLLAVGILSLLVMDSAGANLLYFRVNNGNRRDWKGAFAFVEERSEQGDIVVSTNPGLGDYYLNQETVSWRETDPAAIVDSGERAWFVITPDLARFYKTQEFLDWVSTSGELIDIRYLRRHDDANVYIYLYDPDR